MTREEFQRIDMALRRYRVIRKMNRELGGYDKEERKAGRELINSIKQTKEYQEVLSQVASNVHPIVIATFLVKTKAHLNKERTRAQYRAYCGFGYRVREHKHSESAYKATISILLASAVLYKRIKKRAREREKRLRERLGRELTIREKRKEYGLAVKDVARNFLDMIWRVASRDLLAHTRQDQLRCATGGTAALANLPSGGGVQK